MRNICVDFDGVLNNYEGWKGEDELYTPREDAYYFLGMLSQKYKVIIHTTRNSEKVKEWLKKYRMDKFVSDITSNKVPAMIYIDDRGLKFNGDFVETLKQIENFKTHGE